MERRGYIYECGARQQRVVMHIDMNSYFASCEQQVRPEWRGRPIGVCEHLGGIIIAPSVEAKRWGVKTAMPVWEARKLCPQIILTPTTPDLYRRTTMQFLRLLEEYSDTVEAYSIDEAFVDLTSVCNVRLSYLQPGGVLVDTFAEAAEIAKEIKARIRLEIGDYLRCSVGLAESKLLAKIASDMQKPDGLVVIRPQDKEKLYDKLGLTDIPGIGVRQAARLLQLGVRTLRDLEQTSRMELVRHFGVVGHHLWSMGQLEGSFEADFNTAHGRERVVQSVGHMYTVSQEHRRKSSAAMLVLAKLSETLNYETNSSH